MYISGLPQNRMVLVNYKKKKKKKFGALAKKNKKNKNSTEKCHPQELYHIGMLYLEFMLTYQIKKKHINVDADRTPKPTSTPTSMQTPGDVQQLTEKS